MATAYRKLGQANPAATTNVNLVWKADPDKRYEVERIWIANITGIIATARIFHNKVGVGGSDTALLYDADVPANGILELEGLFYLYDEGDAIVVYSTTGSALVFTAFGKEIDL